MVARSRTNAAVASHSVAAESTNGSNTRGSGQRRLSPRGYIRLSGVLVTLSLLYLFFYVGTPGKSPKISVPPPVEGHYVRRIVAVGDLHGDYDNALKVLRMAHVVDEGGSWSGNVDYFVQTGDIIDRGIDTIKLYTWFEKLREQAHAAGGAILSHLGNHEFMNALADWRYVLPGEITTFGSVAQRQEGLTTGPIGRAWAQNYSVASRLPLHPAAGELFADYNDSASSSSSSAMTHAALSFMHGGLSPNFSHSTPYPSAINKLGSSLLWRCQKRKPQPAPHPPAPYSGLPPDATAAEYDLYNSDGPLWYRGWATDDDKEVCSRVDAVLQKIGVRRLIMGHTPNFEEIVSRCKGKIIIIDTGISKAYSGVLSALSITYTVTPVSVPSPAGVQRVFGFRIPVSGAKDSKDQKSSTRWIEREEVVAIYPDQKVQLAVDERVLDDSFW